MDKKWMRRGQKVDTNVGVQYVELIKLNYDQNSKTKENSSSTVYTSMTMMISDILFNVIPSNKHDHDLSIAY